MITCNHFNRQMSWVLMLVISQTCSHEYINSLLFCLWLLRETHSGNSIATSWHMRHEPDYIKFNLSEEEVQASHKLVCLNCSQQAGISLQFFIHQQLSCLLRTHISFGACCWLHISSNNCPASKKIELWPPLCCIDSSVWSLVVWPTIVLKDPYLPD